MEKITTVKVESRRHRKLKIRSAIESITMLKALSEAIDDWLHKKDLKEKTKNTQ